jgi:hypothetical protein
VRSIEPGPRPKHCYANDEGHRKPTFTAGLVLAEALFLFRRERRRAAGDKGRPSGRSFALGFQKVTASIHCLRAGGAPQALPQAPDAADKIELAVALRLLDYAGEVVGGAFDEIVVRPGGNKRQGNRRAAMSEYVACLFP